MKDRGGILLETVLALTLLLLPLGLGFGIFTKVVQSRVEEDREFWQKRKSLRGGVAIGGGHSLSLDHFTTNPGSRKNNSSKP